MQVRIWCKKTRLSTDPKHENFVILGLNRSHIWQWYSPSSTFKTILNKLFPLLFYPNFEGCCWFDLIQILLYISSFFSWKMNSSIKWAHPKGISLSASGYIFVICLGSIFLVKNSWSKILLNISLKYSQKQKSLE